MQRDAFARRRRYTTTIDPSGTYDGYLVVVKTPDADVTCHVITTGTTTIYLSGSATAVSAAIGDFSLCPGCLLSNYTIRAAMAPWSGGGGAACR